MTTTTPPPRGVQPVRPRTTRRLPWPLSLYQSAVGKKWVMALTGLGLVLFLIFHMIGNFHLYEGPRQIGEYAEALRGIGGHLVPRTLLLWLLRVGLILMFAFHIHAAYSLRAMGGRVSDDVGAVTGNKEYASKQDYIAANFASRTMRWTGPIIALYILFHLADLTWGRAPHSKDEWVAGDPYHNVVESFGNPVVALIYIVANIAVCIHLYHGVYSMFQSLGVNNPKINGAKRGIAVGVAGILLVGNLSFPIMVQAGLVSEDERTTPIPPAEEVEEASE